MRMKALKIASFMTAGVTILGGMALRTPSLSQSIDKPDTPLKVALVLDCITQPRFQDDMRNFGMSRLLPIAGGHLVSGQLALQSKEDRELYKKAQDSGRDFAIGFLHCAHVPGKPAPATRQGGAGGFSPHPGLKTIQLVDGKPGASKPSYTDPSYRLSNVANNLDHLLRTAGPTRMQEYQKIWDEMGKESLKALPTLMKGQGAQQDTGDWLIVERPVRAMKDSCLKCHEGAKKGDTLGVLTYVVSKQVYPKPAGSPAVGGAGRPGKGFKALD